MCGYNFCNLRYIRGKIKFKKCVENEMLNFINQVTVDISYFFLV